MNVINSGVRLGLIATAAAALSLGAISSHAQTTTVTSSTVPPTTTTNWSVNLSVPQFNPASFGGDALTSVTITLTWTTEQAGTITNTDGSSDDVYLEEAVNVQAQLPDGSFLTGTPPNLMLGSATMVGPFTEPTYPLASGASLVSAGSSVTPGTPPVPVLVPIVTTGTQVSQTYTDGTTLGLFTGSGTVLFPVAGNGVDTEADSNGNTLFGSLTAAGATISVTYTYKSTSNTTSPFTTFTQGGWGTTPHGQNPGYYLSTYFPTVCPDGIIIGDINKNYFLFTSAAAIEAFLPQGSGPALLPAGHQTNPTGKMSELYGQLLSVNLSIAFSNGNVFHSGLGSLHVQSGPFKGYTVSAVATLANQVLGGTASLPAGISIGDLDTCLDNINSAFDDGTTNTGFIK